MYPALELDLLEALDLSIRQPVLYFQLRIQPMHMYQQIITGCFTMY